MTFRSITASLALALVVFTTACTSKGPSPSIPMESYNVSLSLSGVLMVPNQSLGTISVPQGSVGLADLAVSLAALYFQNSLNYKTCKFSPATQSTNGGVVSVSVSATCVEKGIPITEGIAVTLAPVVEPVTITPTVSSTTTTLTPPGA